MKITVLCFDCHRETQIRGGFDRKLDADQIVLFRDDWHVLMSQRRAAQTEHSRAMSSAATPSLSLSTSIAEIYRENKEYELLATHYNAIGNSELRDKYVELALRGKPSDNTVWFLRGLQGRPDLIPPDVLKRELMRFEQYGDHTESARLLAQIGRTKEAAIAYVRGILESLEDDNVFSAAYYIKELAGGGVLQALFVHALKRAQKEEDLWWQVRALEELGWEKELQQLLMEKRHEIELSDNPPLQVLLAETLGETDKVIQLRKEMARNEHATADGIEIREAIPVNKEMARIFADQRARFVKKFGREPSKTDPIFFDPLSDSPTALTPNEIRHEMLRTMDALDIPEKRRREILKSMGFD